MVVTVLCLEAIHRTDIAGSQGLSQVGCAAFLPGDAPAGPSRVPQLLSHPLWLLPLEVAVRPADGRRLLGVGLVA